MSHAHDGRGTYFATTVRTSSSPTSSGAFCAGADTGVPKVNSPKKQHAQQRAA